MAKKKEDVKDIEVKKEVVVTPKKDVAPKKDFKLYPLKKETKIGGEIKPIGYKIKLTKDGYRFYKQKNIV